jgi:hypothetical protein
MSRQRKTAFCTAIQSGRCKIVKAFCVASSKGICPGNAKQHFAPQFNPGGAKSLKLFALPMDIRATQKLH